MNLQLKKVGIITTLVIMILACANSVFCGQEQEIEKATLPQDQVEETEDVSWEYSGPVSASELLGQRRFEGITLDIPSTAGNRVMEAVWNEEPLFNSLTGISVTTHPFPHSNLYAKQMAEIMVNSGAFDLFMGIQMSWPAFSPRLIPLNEYIERDFGSVDNFKRLFYPIAINRATFGGDVKLVPFQYTGQFLVYRKDLFEDPAEKAAFKAKYGYELQPPDTIQQFIDIAQFFTRPEDDLWGFVFMGKGPPGGWAMIETLHGAGLEIIDPKTGKVPFVSGVNREKAIEVANFWYDLVHTYHVAPPGQAGIGHSDCYEWYIGGHAAMSFGWWGDFWDRVVSSEIIADIGETGSVPFPTIEKGTGGFNALWAYGIPKMSDNPEAAWEFLKFLISEEVCFSMIKNSGTGLAQPNVNNIAAEKGWMPSACLATIPRSKPNPRYIHSWEISDLYWRYSASLYAGDLTPEQFVDLIIERTNKITR